MPPSCFSRNLVSFVSLSVAVWFGFVSGARAQITIQGVADRTTYTDSAAFRVVTNAGFTYEVTLNGLPVAAGVTHTVTVMDYYDLAVRRTQISDGSVTSALVRFIVLSSRRGSPELGLIEWVPLPPVPSTGQEMAGTRLLVMTPQDYPAGLDIPVIARVEDGAGNTRRVNGWMSGEGFEGSAFRVLRGVGHGFLPPAAAGTLVYSAQLQSLQTNKQINIEASTTWTTVSGLLGGTTAWPDNARIHVTGHLTVPAGGTLTVGQGTVVRLNPSVNITNRGRIVVNGTIVRPVVFTATNRVAPEQHTGAWGGFLMTTPGAELTANAAIMTGAGALRDMGFNTNFPYASTHRSEQPLLMIHYATVRMTNCALINNAGQIGNGYFSSITWDHCLLQRAITCGEYEGCTNIINHSAIIEFPSVDGVYNATIADADYDGIYLIRGTNFFANSLLGFAKDDAIDSGSGGAGTVVVSNCWVESSLHEALAWSGEGRRTWTYDTVLINNGQGIECGWSTGANSPLCYASRLLSLGNSVGARYGDNYEGTTGLGFKDGFLTVTNSFILHNYRNVWGQVWDNTWNYRVAGMDIRNNWLTAPNTNHPNNAVWNPTTDAPRLAAFMTAPTDAPVGIGIALWPNQFVPSMLTNGVPVRLSSFTTNTVTVDYSVKSESATLAAGTLTFTPGETVEKIYLPQPAVEGLAIIQVSLDNPAGGELTGDAVAYFANPPATPQPPSTTLIPYGASWKYLDDGSNQGIAWRNPGFNDTGWSNGLAQLGFADGDEATPIRRTNSSGTIATFYFRKTVSLTNLSEFATFRLRLLRDDAGIVYLNGFEVLRSPNMPAGEVPYNVFTGGSAPPDNTVDTTDLVNTGTLLSNGVNLVTAEIHQQSPTSSDASFDLQLAGLPASPIPLFSARFGSDLVLYWSDPTFRLEFTDALPGGWQPVAGAASPFAVVPSVAKRFYRLRK